MSADYFHDTPEDGWAYDFRTGRPQACGVCGSHMLWEKGNLVCESGHLSEENGDWVPTPYGSSHSKLPEPLLRVLYGGQK